VDEDDGVVVGVPSVGPQPISSRHVYQPPPGWLRAETERKLQVFQHGH
jgi:hypothetical protein